MADNILSSLFSQASFTITDPSGNVVGKNIKVIRVSIKYDAKLMQHTMEDGTNQIDAKIILAPTVGVDFYCPTLDDQTEINDMLLDRTKTYEIATKGLILSPMMVASENITQSPDVLSVAPLHLTFKQLLIQTQKPIIFKQPADSSLIDGGLSTLSAATQTVSNLASTVAKVF